MTTTRKTETRRMKSAALLGVTLASGALPANAQLNGRTTTTTFAVVQAGDAGMPKGVKVRFFADIKPEVAAVLTSPENPSPGGVLNVLRIQNGLMAQGTPQSLGALQKLIDTMSGTKTLFDATKAHVEVEAQFIRTTVAQANALLPGSSPTGAAPVNVKSAAFLEKLKAAQAAGRAAIVNSPRATTFDGTPVSLKTVMTRIDPARIEGLPFASAGEARLVTTRGFDLGILTASGSDGGVILTFAEPFAVKTVLEIEGQEGELPLNQAPSPRGFSIAQRKDESVVLRGYHIEAKNTVTDLPLSPREQTPQSGRFLSAPAPGEAETLIVLTARVLRRPEK